MTFKRFALLGTAAAICQWQPAAAQANGEQPLVAEASPEVSAEASADIAVAAQPAAPADVAVDAIEVVQTAASLAPQEPFDLSVQVRDLDAKLTASVVTPQFRNINTFDSNIDPYYRNINTFWKGIDPLYRNINTFWGTLNPYYRNINTFGTVLPDYRNIQTFWNTNGTLWGNTQALWAKVDAGTSTYTERTQLASNLNTLIANAKTYWGPAIIGRKGGTFQSSFVVPLFSEYGLTTYTGQGLMALPSSKRGAFFMDWFDGLNGYTGFDQVDYWMQQTKWSPLLSAVQGGGKGVTVGLIDTKLANDADLLSKVTTSSGSTTYSNEHGTAVASLIAANHDGRNIMGIAPNVKLAVYNPFDENAEATWRDVADGLDAITGAGASVVNLSLGEPGSTLDQAWDFVFLAAEREASTVFVIAAGNDGTTQTKDVYWTLASDIAFLLVGSVNPDNQISSFSNRPGDACLLYLFQCEEDADFGEGGYLKNYFLVAPGENILASDGKGGVDRYSGTSLSAPLVTGTIALLQGRWPWLKSYPVETASIVLESATDLGAPGVDEIYGWGLLNIEGAQAPLDFSKLTYYTVKSGVSTPRTLTDVRSSTNRQAWATSGMYISAFERIGKTQRDFVIPLSTGLYGTQINGVYYQDFVYNRLISWANAPMLAMSGGRLSLNDGGRETVMPDRWGFKLSMRSRVSANNPRVHKGSKFQVDNSVTFADAQDRYSLTAGNGSNSFTGRQTGFGLESDYAALDGGVNPILGFASGGAHLRADWQAAPGLHVSFGSSMTREDAYEQGRFVTSAIAPDFRAAAQNLQIEYAPKSWLSLNASLTTLTEDNSLLGVQAGGAESLIGPSRTNAVTVGASVEPLTGFTLSASGTRSRSTSVDRGAAYRTGSKGLLASAWQVAAARTGIVSGSDHLRLSLAQPLSVRSGGIDITTLAVIDRETGQIGPVTQQLSVADKARLVGELDYSLPMQGGHGEFSLFGRGDFRNDAHNAQGLTAGARVRMMF